MQKFIALFNKSAALLADFPLSEGKPKFGLTDFTSCVTLVAVIDKWARFQAYERNEKITRNSMISELCQYALDRLMTNESLGLDADRIKEASGN